MKHTGKTLGLIACAIKIFAGTIYYGSIEAIKETCVPSPGAKWSKDNKCADDYAKFKAPFYMGILLFFSMSFTLIPYFIFRHGKPGVTKFNPKSIINMLLPTACEFVGQIMFLVGAAKFGTPMSLALTLKGSRVVFSALLLIWLMKRKLYAFHWFAVATVLSGLIVASVPTLLPQPGSGPAAHGSTPSWYPIVGVALVVVAEFIRSLRTVLEEKLMKKLRYDPLLVVGLQGILAFFMALPCLWIFNEIPDIKDSSKPFEDLSKTFKSIGSSGIIIGLMSSFPIVVSSLFIAGAYVTKLMSSVHNALTTILTNALVWGISFIVYYADDSHFRGHAIKALDSVQLVGFIMVLFGCLIYDADLKLRCLFKYPLDEAAAAGIGDANQDSYLNDAEFKGPVDVESVETEVVLSAEEEKVMADEQTVVVKQ